MNRNDFDSLCDEFESAWQNGQRPEVDHFLQRVADTERAALLRELIQIELWWRRNESPRPALAVYQAQFARYAAAVVEAFALFADRSGRTLLPDRDGTPMAQTLSQVPAADHDHAAETAGPDRMGEPRSKRVKYFGEYELLEEIARGGMGVVYRARQRKLNRIVALKMILSGQLASQEEVRRFQTEAEAAANLDHPGIVPIFEIGEHSGQHFFSMGFVEGESLADKIKDGPLTPRTAAELTLQSAQAITYAHQLGVIHRDLKPANVLLDRDEKPRITDFGLARRLSVDSGLTATGEVLGTPAYMPPEQARGHTDEIGPAADVYSLGGILYCLLTGRPPFQSATVVDTLKQVLEQEPAAPTTLVGSTPKDLETICLKCLQKEPGRRYETAAELVDELQRYLNGKPILARPIGSPERAWRWCRRQPALASLMAAVVLLVLLLAIGGPLVALQQAALRKQAEGDRKQARRAKGKAIEQQRIAQGKAEEIERTLARSNFFLAQAMWDKSRSQLAFTLLHKIPPQYRNVEWRLLLHELEGSAATLYGHVWGISSISLSRDGTRITSGSYDGRIKIWSASTGKELKTLQGHSSAVEDVHFSPDGRQIASGGMDRTIKIWDVATGLEVRTLKGHLNAVRSVSFSPDGTRILSGGSGKQANQPGEVKLWNVSMGTQVKTFPGHTGQVNSVSFSPDGTRILTGGGGKAANESGEIRLWNVATGSELRTFTGDMQAVHSVGFSSSGKRLVSGHQDGTIRLWDVATGKEINRLPGASENASVRRIGRVSFSPDDSRVVSAGAELKLWNAWTGQELDTRKGHSGFVSGACFSLDSRRLVTGSFDGTIKIWDLATGQDFAPLVDDAPVECLDDNFSGTRLVSGNRRGTIKLWNPHSNELIRSIQAHPRTVFAARFNSDGSRIVSGGDDPIIKLWDSSTGRLLRTFAGHTSDVKSVNYSPEGARIVTGSRDETIKLWSLTTDHCLQTFVGHTGAVNSVSFHPDGSRIVSGSEDRTVRIWRTATGDQVIQLTVTGGPVTSVCFSPDGTQVVGGGAGVKMWDSATGQELMTFSPRGNVRRVNFGPDGTRIATTTVSGKITVWDVATGEELKTIQGHAGSALSLRFRPDGSQLVSGGWNGKIKFWDASVVQEAHRLKGHDKTVTAISFSPDGARIASGSFDETIRLWDAETGQQLAQMTGHSNAVVTIVFSPEGSRVASGSWDGTIRVWDALTGKQLHTFPSHGTDVAVLRFSTDGTRLLSRYAGDKDMIWDLQTGKQRAADNDQDFPERRPTNRSADGRWLAVAAVEEIRLLDLTASENPGGRRKLESLVRPRPRWHKQQFHVARAAKRWYTATFHAAWLLKITPSDARLNDALQQAHRQLQKAHNGQTPPLPEVVLQMLKRTRAVER